jgi:hypothetical protein
MAIHSSYTNLSKAVLPLSIVLEKSLHLQQARRCYLKKSLYPLRISRAQMDELEKQRVAARTQFQTVQK